MNSLQAAKSISCIDLYNTLTGSSYKGHGNVKCINPEHEDNNASMQLTTKSFKCFACNTGGSVVDLYAFSKSINLQHNKSMLFKLSEELCDLFKIKYEKQITKVDNDQQDYFDMMHYYLLITKTYLNSVAGDKIKTYLNARGFDNKFIQTNDFGFVPKPFIENNKTFDIKQTMVSKVSVDKLYEYGLMHDDKLSFDNRIIIPIHDDNGRVIALAGRSNGTEPKYLLMKSNKYWEKHKQIYNWHQAAGYKTLIIVEGFMDALSFLQAGINNVVSLMGLSISEQQYNKLAKKEILLALDNDKAGHEAMFNIINRYKDLNIWIPNWYLPRPSQQKLIHLSSFKDANDIFINNKNDLAEFKMNNTITKYEYVIRYYKKYKELNNPYIIQELRDLLAKLLAGKDKTTIHMTTKIFNRMLGIKEEN